MKFSLNMIILSFKKYSVFTVVTIIIRFQFILNGLKSNKNVWQSIQSYLNFMRICCLLQPQLHTRDSACGV
jgi:hypothetical protein